MGLVTWPVEVPGRVEVGADGGGGGGDGDGALAAASCHEVGSVGAARPRGGDAARGGVKPPSACRAALPAPPADDDDDASQPLQATPWTDVICR